MHVQQASRKAMKHMESRLSLKPYAHLDDGLSSCKELLIDPQAVLLYGGAQAPPCHRCVLLIEA